jgi:hypothetical protein
MIFDKWVTDSWFIITLIICTLKKDNVETYAIHTEINLTI